MLANIIPAIVANNPQAVLRNLHGLGIAQNYIEINYERYMQVMMQMDFESAQQSIDTMVASLDVPILQSGYDASYLNQIEAQYQTKLSTVLRSTITTQISGNYSTAIVAAENQYSKTSTVLKSLTQDQQIILGFALIGFVVSLVIVCKIIFKIAKKIISDEN